MYFYCNCLVESEAYGSVELLLAKFQDYLAQIYNILRLTLNLCLKKCINFEDIFGFLCSVYTHNNTIYIIHI